MTSALAYRVHYTFAEYVALEQDSNVKHEYLGGLIYAMAGRTVEHAALQGAVIGLLFSRLGGGRCRVLTSDLKVRVRPTGLTTYPDVTVVCGPYERDPAAPNLVISNPTLLVEVTSPSSEEYDRGAKFEHYKQLASLAQYVIVSHREPRVDVWTRAADEWACATAREGEVAQLGAIDCTLPVRELYAFAAEATG